jgi:hypothetical protein
MRTTQAVLHTRLGGTRPASAGVNPPEAHLRDQTPLLTRSYPPPASRTPFEWFAPGAEQAISFHWLVAETSREGVVISVHGGPLRAETAARGAVVVCSRRLSGILPMTNDQPHPGQAQPTSLTDPFSDTHRPRNVPPASNVPWSRNPQVRWNHLPSVSRDAGSAAARGDGGHECPTVALALKLASFSGFESRHEYLLRATAESGLIGKVQASGLSRFSGAM